VSALSPFARARLAGLFQLLEGAASSSGQVFILGSLVVGGEAAATAHNILTHEALFRLGFLVSVAGVAFHLVWGLLMYQLLRPVQRTVAAIALLLIVTCGAMQALTALLYLAPILVLQGPASGRAQDLAYALVQLNGAAFNLDLVFFGLWCVLTGWLIWRSGFLPRLLGALLALDGVGWTLYLWPPLATFVFPAIAAASALAEVPLMAWLLIKGVDSERWTERAVEAEAPGASPWPAARTPA
jgi:hypothetical protein